MPPAEPVAEPSGHTPEGGVIVGNADAAHAMVLFEDPQCPDCRQFEEVNGHLITTAVEAGELAVEYRMRCFLGPESMRADNALALAAESGRFDELRQALFARTASGGIRGLYYGRPPASRRTLRTDRLRDSSWGVRRSRYEKWVLRREAVFQREDPQGTPAAWLNGQPDRFDAALRQGGVRERASARLAASGEAWIRLSGERTVGIRGRTRSGHGSSAPLECCPGGLAPAHRLVLRNATSRSADS